MRVIGYGSRSLHPAEQNYHSGRLEFLCLKWAVCEHFRDYLLHAKNFEIVTDNNPLLYCMSTSKLNATTVRWVNELADFNFTIRYRPGPVHVDVDTLSRLPLDLDKYMALCTRTVDFNNVDMLLKASKNASVGTISAQTFHNAENIKSIQAELDTLKSISLRDFRAAQNESLDIRRVIDIITSDTYPSVAEKRAGTAYFRSLARYFKNLVIIDGVLYKPEKEKALLVVPPKYTSLVYHELHVNMGHLGVNRVYQLAKERFFWPNMQNDIKNFITNCCPCVRDKHPLYRTQCPLQSISSSAPFEMISVDFLELEKSGQYRYLLVIVDHFTRYAEVFPTCNKSAKTAASKLYDQFILRYGYPERLHSDRGGEFTNQIWKEINSMCRIKKTQTTAYHPQGNGQVERFNRTLVQMLRTLSDDHKHSWQKHAQKLTHAYNCTVNDATGYSPFYLLYGRNPRLPIDLIFEPINDKEKKTYTKYVADWKESMREAYRKAAAAAEKSVSKGRKFADRHIRFSVLQSRDRVLTKRMTDKKGNGKIKSYWNDDLFEVIRQIGDSSVYEIKNSQSGKIQVVHRNNMLQCNSLPIIAPNPSPEVLPIRKRTPENKSNIEYAGDDSDSNSDNETEFEHFEDNVVQPRRSLRIQNSRYPVLSYVYSIRPHTYFDQNVFLANMPYEYFGNYNFMQMSYYTLGHDAFSLYDLISGVGETRGVLC